VRPGRTMRPMRGRRTVPIQSLGTDGAKFLQNLVERLPQGPRLLPAMGRGHVLSLAEPLEHALHDTQVDLRLVRRLRRGHPACNRRAEVLSLHTPTKGDGTRQRHRTSTRAPGRPCRRGAQATATPKNLPVGPVVDRPGSPLLQARVWRGSQRRRPALARFRPHAQSPSPDTCNAERGTAGCRHRCRGQEAEKPRRREGPTGVTPTAGLRAAPQPCGCCSSPRAKSGSAVRRRSSRRCGTWL
jgi:hypothetical protein